MDTKIELIVFAPPSEAAPVLESFAAYVKDNITDPKEQEGFWQIVRIHGHDFPAHCQVEWADFEIEEAIDEWVDGQEDAPPFAVIFGRKAPTITGCSFNVWSRFPGQDARLMDNIVPQHYLIYKMGHVEGGMLGYEHFSKELIEVIVDNHWIDGLSEHLQAITINEQTPRASQSSQSRRI